MPRFDHESEKRDPGCADDAAETEQQPNNVVGPLTDDELKAGGMERVAAFIRNHKSKDALRQAKRRAKQKDAGKCEINVKVQDNQRARATMKAAASAIDDEVAHRAFEELLRNDDLRSLIVDITTRPELQELVNLSHKVHDSEGSFVATPKSQRSSGARHQTLTYKKR